MKILVTGGAGFIGSALVRKLIQENKHQILNIDMLTYAGNLESIGNLSESENYIFSKTDISDYHATRECFKSFQPDVVMHLAAESHVDRSIENPMVFINTNIIGTYNLLEISREYLKDTHSKKFKFIHVSTDEVFGDLPHPDDMSENSINKKFTEESAYMPSSPYSASKAGSDHLVRAWHRTFNLPTIVTNCSNNYGPFQLPEKLIPLTILNALQRKPLPVFGNGRQIRDWLYVEDHVEALIAVLSDGIIGESYNIGGNNEVKNISVVQSICSILDELHLLKSSDSIDSFSDLIEFVSDRPGHDKRYSIDASRITSKLNWKPKETFKTGLAKTVDWYVKNQNWCNIVMKKNT